MNWKPIEQQNETKTKKKYHEYWSGRSFENGYLDTKGKFNIRRIDEDWSLLQSSICRL